MSKRFGRKQKRKLREEIESLKKDLKLQHYNNKNSNLNSFDHFRFREIDIFVNDDFDDFKSKTITVRFDAAEIITKQKLNLERIMEFQQYPQSISR